MSNCCQDKQKSDSKIKPVTFTQMVKKAFGLDINPAKINAEGDCCHKENGQNKPAKASCH